MNNPLIRREDDLKMVRTSSRLARVASSGSTKSVDKKSNRSSSSSSASSSPGENAGNKRKTATIVLRRKRKNTRRTKKEDNKNTVFIRGFYISKKDIEEAGCSKDSHYESPNRNDNYGNKENLENNSQSTKRFPVCVSPDKPIKKMKPSFYNSLVKFETVGRSVNEADTESDDDIIKEEVVTE